MAFAIYIAAAAAIGLLIGFVALSITWLEKAVLHNIRSKTVGLLSVYDEILEQKSRELSRVESRMEARRTTEEEPEEIISDTPRGPSSRAMMNLVEQVGLASYRDGNVSNIYKMIRENFSFTLDEVAPALSDTYNTQTGPATKLLEKLDWDTVYELSTLLPEHQVSVLDDVLDNQSKILVKNHIQNFGSFNVLEFYESLKAIRDTEPKPVTLRVSPELTGFIRKYRGVDVIPDEEICEGFQVEENHLLYDYCIKARELR